jgi:hypothetical protein
VVRHIILWKWRSDADPADVDAVARWVASDDHERLGARIAGLCERVAVLDHEEPFPHAAHPDPPAGADGTVSP